MIKWQKQVQAFHHEIVGGPTSPASPKIRDGYLRARLIVEEATETCVGLVGASQTRDLLREFVAFAGIDEKPDVVEVIDGLCDLIYVALGTAEAIGVDLEPFFDEVHRSNMAKTSEAVNGYGKRGGKPPGWVAPRISEILEAYRRNLRGVGE